ncbi:hypothetical protein COO91_03333 [Nostoc flagelliforme CCNUN1]|uniref:Uncharacterized protein n=1 Tax=Nostoc flagelliforme CCNUN1 TaxID=2038116 RepID=A0A2K8SPQ7_9NOSO|nr:hypothetical protein COO91_03333 [Nostoc flagelliforme CCNUN1]
MQLLQVEQAIAQDSEKTLNPLNSCFAPYYFPLPPVATCTKLFSSTYAKLN